MPKSHYYGLILAGGRGTRFWPRSRRRCAKQVLNVIGERTLIQATVARLAPLLSPGRLWVLTNDYLREEIVRQLPEVPPEQILAEPAARNTAPAIGLAAHILHSIDPDAVMGVFPSDHVIGKPARFRRHLRVAFGAAESGKLAVLGIHPRWAETGYGYIEVPAGAKPLQPVPVLRFREKPDAATAKRYLKAGRFYWNAGMFFWRADVLLQELRTYQPRTSTMLAGLPRFGDAAFPSELERVFPRCEKISMDYAVLERSRRVVAVPCDDFEWSDLGSWNAIYELLPRDGDGNTRNADVVQSGSRGNYVDANGKLVALVGVQDLVVVDTPDALLVASRHAAQDVGRIVELLEQRKREDLL